jgi:RND family efflux transporter MFP subunit
MKQILARVWSLAFLIVCSSSLPAAELQGEVQWAGSLVLTTNLDAEVVQATAHPGQRVNKGELLVQLEDGVVRARLLQARAELAFQALSLAEAKNELQRSEELYDRTLLSDHDLDMARIAHAGASSGHQRAAADLMAAQRAVELAHIVAPFDGVVMQRHVQAGEMVNGQLASVPLYTLVASAHRRVRLAVSASQIATMTVGDELELQIGTRRYAGRVDAISGYGDSVGSGSGSGSGSVTIDILFTPRQGESVVIGEKARVNLP